MINVNWITFVPEQVKGTFYRLQLICSDAGYFGQLVDWINSVCGWMLEIVKRNDDYQKGPYLAIFGLSNFLPGFLPDLKMLSSREENPLLKIYFYSGRSA